MKNMIDYQQEDDELQISHGDFIKGESTIQHQTDLLCAEKGDYKLNPTMGVAALAYVDDEDPQNLRRAIAVEFTRDGMQVNKIDWRSNTNLTIDAFYK
jgi:hypothetical protein